MTNNLDKHDLYERCVQSPEHLLPMLCAMHAVGPASSRCVARLSDTPRILGEDFAGTAALSYLWADADPANHAIAIDLDLDKDTLHRRPQHDRVTRIVGDVRDATTLNQQPGASAAHACDILFVGNFSIGYLHTRAELLAYLVHARARLNPGGVFLCDTYGGESAFIPMLIHRDHTAPDGRRIRYTWEQRDANPLTGMVTDVLHFEIDRAGMIEAEFPDAFVYHWRLWSVPELLDAMAEAGFTATEVYDKSPDAEDEDGKALMLPMSGDGDVEDSFIVFVAGRVSADD